MERSYNFRRRNNHRGVLKDMAKAMRVISQTLFLILFIVLSFTGKIQIWMGVFIVGVILTPLLGRFFCGWVCPINTAMNLVTNVKNKLHVKSKPISQFIKKPMYRYGMLIAFILSFVFVMLSGRKLPVLPGLLVSGVVLTIFFPESLWHRYLCPYGTILHIAGRSSKHSYNIINGLCISCGICHRVCPSEAISLNESQGKKYSINSSECLVCGRCQEACPKNAVEHQ